MWRHRVHLKHLLTEDESYAAVQKSMSAIADVVEQSSCFNAFLPLDPDWRAIPRGDRYFSPVDYADALLDELYDFADAHSIWIE